MLKILRSLRKQMLDQKKLTNYLVYAIGEVILVVIGILIALAINNTQEKKKIAEKETIYLYGLQKEFQTSRQKLETLLKVNRENYLGAREILTLVKNPDGIADEKAISKLIYRSFSNDIAFNPNNSLLMEMINSGSLRDLSDPELRKALTNWLSTLEDIAKQEAELKEQRDHVLDMVRTNEQSLAVILSQAGVWEDKPGPDDKASLESNLNLYRSKAFENNLIFFILAGIATENAHYQPLMEELEHILNLIAQDIE
ncbi:DUF6090 family protein [Robertkochia flava]|uniref:DUF6090 family protein n=1 Tax=Robertkochia flava TaxID=3447986 RepID=UPI001CCC3077|nr:DUF6090 family protein [Robertkochia marina]